MNRAIDSTNHRTRWVMYHEDTDHEWTTAGFYFESELAEMGLSSRIIRPVPNDVLVRSRHD